LLCALTKVVITGYKGLKYAHFYRVEPGLLFNFLNLVKSMIKEVADDEQKKTFTELHEIINTGHKESISLLNFSRRKLENST
jgi:hypothetical protein